ncbi:MAG: hypothetical protein CM1200mP36_02310 [Gammaproteobacteria bacterium]|nr:MAG: hypothetical protein CM1200mP36_02310 [Gammaproteobacteria bacterium]
MSCAALRATTSLTFRNPDPIGDIETVNTELLLADLETAQRSFEKAVKQAKTNEKGPSLWGNLLQQVITELEAGRPVRDMGNASSERTLLQSLQFITAKPLMYVANLDETTPQNNHTST